MNNSASIAAQSADRQSIEAARQRIDARLRRLLATHLDPTGGAAFWLDRQRQLGFNVCDEIRGVADLERLGPITTNELTARPLIDLIPRSQHATREKWIIAQTGGATGDSVWTAYRDDEFQEAFVTPFRIAAEHVDFPRGGMWLYAGPSGPHVIGRAAQELSRVLDGPAPFMVDFDPRWARKLVEGSFAQQRYLRHVVDQALDALRSQDIDVLFTTPRVLASLAVEMSEQERLRIRGVHYGGMSLSADALRQFQMRWFPAAVHLSGYGNTLFGCCLELNTAAERVPTYFPYGDRLLLDVQLLDGDSKQGRVRFSRLDETALLINVLERDQAELVDPPAEAPDGFWMPGLRDVGACRATAPVATGLY